MSEKYNICELLGDELKRLHGAAEEARSDDDYKSEEAYVENMSEIYVLLQQLITKTDVDIAVPSSDITVPNITTEQVNALRKIATK